MLKSTTYFGAAVLWLASVAHAQPPTANVVVTKAEIKRLPNTMTLVGTVEPLTRSVVGSEIAGIVREMPVRQGDAVERGAPIMKLNDDTLRFDLAQAEADLEASKARRTQVEFEIERIQRLYDVKQAGEKEVYDTQAVFDIAGFEVARQKARVEQIRTDLEKTVVRAPFTGFVVDRRAEVGEWMDRGGDVVEMIDLSSVLVRINVPEFAIPFVKINSACDVRIDALNRRFEGKAWHVIRQADVQARTFPVEIIIDNREGFLSGGMFARATIISGPEAESPAVPKDAIIEISGVTYVGTIIRGKHGTMGILVAVTTGADMEDWIAITSGNIKPGAEVIVRGNEFGVYPGFPSPVNIVDEFGRPVERPSGDAAKTHSHGM